MNLKKKFLVLVLIAMTALCLTGCGTKVAMEVDGVKVPQAVVDYYIMAGQSSLSSYGIDTTTDEGKQYLGMIEQQAVTTSEQLAVIRAKATEQGVKVTSDDVDKEFETEKKAFTSEDDYKAFLEKNKLSEDTIKWIIESQLYYKGLEAIVNKDITATDAQLQAAYEKDPTAYDTVNVSYILIKPSTDSSKTSDSWTDADWANAKTKAESVITKLKSGTDFAELAKQNSDDESTKAAGGVLSKAFNAKSEDYVSEFVKAAFALNKVGDYTTEPVKSSQYGYFIIKLDKKTTGWENLKTEITDALLGDQQTENFQKYMEDAMTKMTVEKEYTYQYASDSSSSSSASGTTSSGTTSSGTTSSGTTSSGTTSSGTTSSGSSTSSSGTSGSGTTTTSSGTASN